MEYYDFSDAETPLSLSSASASSSILVDQVTSDFSAEYLKVPGEDLYIRPASRISTPRATDNVSSPESISEISAREHTGIDYTRIPHRNRTSTTSTTYQSNSSSRSSDSDDQSAAAGLSWFSHPQPNAYLPPPTVSTMTSVTPYEVEKLVQSLRTHRVNTLVELRRIEKIFASLSSHVAADVGQPMTAAWSHYVNTHALLSELRAITKNYPFSSECIEEAKRRVYIDPQSNRSWNLCWLVLNKIQTDQLVTYYAHTQASDPKMWGHLAPTTDSIQRLSTAFMAEWNWALSQLLRHWDRPPVR